MINRVLLALVLMLQAAAAWALAPNYPATPTLFRFNGATSNAVAETACYCVSNSSCTKPVTGNKAIYSFTGPVNRTASYSCKINYTDGSWSGELNLEVRWSCPYGGTAPGTSYSRDTSDKMCTNVPDNQGPPPPPPQCGLPAGTPFTFGAWEGWGPLGGDMPETQTVTGYPTSGKNCNLQGSPTLEACYSIVEEGKKHYYCVYNGVSTGTVAAGGASNAPDGPPPDGSVQPERTDQPPKEAPPSTGQCPKGSVMAGYNSAGTPMCVGTGTAPPSTPSAPPTKTTTATTSNADGSTTTTTTTTTTNMDGSTTTVKDIVTTLPNGGGTTTSQTRDTTKTPSGAAGTETKPEEANFCKQNPTLSVCRNSSVSGTCGQIACTGDAIQCATLRAAAAMQCSQAEAEAALKASPQTALGNSILGGTDPMKGDIEAALKGTEVDLSKPALDSSGFLGGGSCLPNRTFAVMGHPVAVDFTSLCNSIQPLRAVIMACAFIAAYMLVSRSVVQS